MVDREWSMFNGELGNGDIADLEIAGDQKGCWVGGRLLSMYGTPIKGGQLGMSPQQWLKMQVAEVRGRKVLMGEVPQSRGVREEDCVEGLRN